MLKWHEGKEEWLEGIAEGHEGLQEWMAGIDECLEGTGM